MTTPVKDPPTSENQEQLSSSFNQNPSPSQTLDDDESLIATDLQSRTGKEKWYRSSIQGPIRSRPDKEEKSRDEKGQFIAKDKDVVCIHRLNQAHAIMYTRIHPSLTGRLSQNKGKICPIALWSNIQAFGAGKKKANVFKVWYKLNHLELRSNNITQFTTEYWNCIATLQSLDQPIEPQSLGHALLAKIPSSLNHVQDALIAAGSSSNAEVSHESVLDLLDSQLSAAIPEVRTQPNHPLPRSSEPGEAAALLTQRCPQGRHIPSPTHTADNCFSLHPEKLVEFRKAMKAKQEAEAHLAMFVPPSMYNVEVSDGQEHSNSNLVDSLQALPSTFNDDDSDGHESEVSLI
ncbi:hypothetical protein PSTT_16459 [Puccinia striiformis]|uniref:Uncharacterized protein n=1 Tax=Puccinia striiformis TaxID=27350 RepID=A0A2S4UD60_9BASI|nr:hypothetical protein PSTT_16459 [Puccinia striiformis]